MKLETYLSLTGIKPYKFAKQVGVAPVTLYRVLNGTNRPRGDTMDRIAAATDGAVTPDDFSRPLPKSSAVASPAASPQASEQNPALACGLPHTEDAA